MMIQTERLRLLPAEPAVLACELSGQEGLAAALSAVVPSDWPPPLNDADSFQYVLDQICDPPGDLGWWFWYVIERSPDGSEPDAAVGICGFKGPPREGSVEIGYSIVPARQRQGIALEACTALIGWARDKAAIRRVVAHTLPDLLPSIRLAERLGFKQAGLVEDPDHPGTPPVLRLQLDL